jgi:predicted acetyltransferase
VSASSYPIRPGTVADLPEIARQDGVQFGYEFRGRALEDVLRILDPERFLIATAGAPGSERVVGVSGEYDLNFSLPGGGNIDMPAVTWVSVAPTHTRRGILRSLLETQLRRYIDEGAAASTLTASQGGIYERFGFGAATQIREMAISTHGARLRREVDATGVWLGTADEARSLLPDVHERWRTQVPGLVRRNAARWDAVIDDPSDSGQRKMFLLHEDGYVVFRPELHKDEGHPDSTLRIIEYATTTPQAHAALWQSMLSMELYAWIETEMAPIDDPIEHLLLDARQVRTRSVADLAWVRPLNIAALLSARSYAVEFEVVWELRDSLLGDARYRIKGGAEGAEVARTDDSADLSSDVSVLGALYLGGHRLQSFLRGGRAEGGDEGLLRRVDRALLADRAPLAGTSF